MKIEVDAVMNAAVAKVSVERSGVAEGAEKLTQVAKIIAQFLGSYRRVFPSLPMVEFAGNVRSGAKGGFADVPDFLSLTFIGEERKVRGIG